jgi:hypothetical protein
MEPFNENLPPIPEEIVTEDTLQADWQAWKDNPPDPEFTSILEAEVE